MDDVLFMNVRHTLKDTFHQLRGLLVRKFGCRGFDVGLERTSWRVVHAHVELTVELNQMFHFNNVRMV